MARRSSYETYVYWVEKYGGMDKIMGKRQFEEYLIGLKAELAEKGKPAVSLARAAAQKTSFTYSYETGLAIKRAFQEYSSQKITLREARNFLTYDENRKAIRDNEFWQMVSKLYKDKKKQVGTKEAGEYISTTIFGS